MAGTSVEALSTAAETLVANGYGTSSTVRKIEALGDALGCPVRCMVEWGQISLTTPEGDPVATLQVRPENINMSKVSATLRIIDAAVHDAEPKSRAIADDLVLLNCPQRQHPGLSSPARPARADSAPSSVRTRLPPMSSSP